MIADDPGRGRLSIWQAAFVVARRDFFAILLSRAFVFFILGPLFPVVIMGLTAGLGRQVSETIDKPEIGIAMEAADAEAMVAAYETLSSRLGSALPRMTIRQRLAPGQEYDASTALEQSEDNLAAIVSGNPSAPRLTATEGRLERWKGPVSLVAAEAMGEAPSDFPEVALAKVSTSGASAQLNRALTAQAGLLVLFLLIMLLAGMVLSNLVEEKGNKVIEILAAAIPMDAVFLGKLFAMLAVSFVGIAVWGSVGAVVMALAGSALPELPTPGVGWPLFFALGVIYFAMGYLLLGSIFLAIGSMAATVRDVQTMNMPVTMLQLVVFFFANYAMADPGSPAELAAIAFPLSSPFVMFARAAQEEALWPHLLAIAWQIAWVSVFVRAGTTLFRRKVMKSGPAGKSGKGGLTRLFRLRRS